MTEGLSSYKVPKGVCPQCGELLDGATSASRSDARAPKAGDFSVCWYCAEALRFTEDLSFRSVTQQDMEELEPEAKAVFVKAIALRLLELGEASLNEILKRSGYTTQPLDNGRKDVLRDGKVVCENVTAGMAWEWLRKEKMGDD